ncbi:MAG: hypothetical protein NXI04_17160 [Planctomycetaceae bacterium]|nr:hypothetical protein [Planctomycetaceae bacterium]
MHSTIEGIYQSFLQLLKFLAAFIRRRQTQLSVVVMSLIVVSVLALGYREFAETDITVLAGPEGGAGSIYAQSIVSASRENVQLGNIRIESEATRGFEDNRDRVARDKSGTLIGFANDGFGDSSNVRILLPLEEDYLHVLCSREFYRKLLACRDCGDSENSQPAGKRPVAVASSRAGDVQYAPVPPDQEESEQQAPAARPPLIACGTDHLPELYHILYLCRNYNQSIANGSDRATDQSPVFVLGPEGSGARRLALELLNHFRFDSDEYQELQISDWTGVRNDLNRNLVDVAFFLGPLDSPVMGRIARDNSAFLVGLGDDAAALSADLSNPTRIHHMVRYQYGRNIEPPTNHSGETAEVRNFGGNNIRLVRKPEFCEPIAVLTTRRVLICSEAMPIGVAYDVVRLARDAINGQIPGLNWSAVTAASDAPDGLSFPLHPAAKLLRDDLSPSSLPDIPGWLWPTVFLPVILLFIQSVARWTGSSLTAEPAPAAEPSDSAMLESRLSAAVEELDQKPTAAAKDWHLQWQQKVRTLQEDLAQSSTGAETREQLGDRIDQLLRRYTELEFLDSRTKWEQMVATVERLEMERALEGSLTPTKQKKWNQRIDRLKSLISELHSAGEASPASCERLYQRLEPLKEAGV